MTAEAETLTEPERFGEEADDAVEAVLGAGAGAGAETEAGAEAEV